MKKYSSKSLFIQTIFICALFGVSLLRTVSAGPITNIGGAPYVKLGVYQGVLSIIPGGTNDQVMEIGNVGRDFAATGDFYFRPQSLGATADPVGAPAVTNNVRIFKNGSNLASLQVPGDICTSSSACAGTAVYDVSTSSNVIDGVSGKLTDGTNAKSAIYGENSSPNGFAGYFSGKVKVADKPGGAAGQVCFNDNTCQTTAWTGAGAGSQTLDQVLALGNKSNTSISLGSGTGQAASPSGALLDVRSAQAAYFKGTLKRQGNGAPSASGDVVGFLNGTNGSTCTSVCATAALACVVGWNVNGSTITMQTCSTATPAAPAVGTCLCK